MSDEKYYNNLINQDIKSLRSQLNTLEFSMCYQKRIADEAKQVFLRAETHLKMIQRQHELLDRELAKLDGRYKQIPPPKTIEKKRRKEDRIRSAGDLATMLTKEQKAALLAELLK